MTAREEIKERAIDASLLDERILKNVQHQRVDLVQWIFDRINVRPGNCILELCSGTGNQTLKLLDLIGENGKVVAVDISESALKKLKDKVGTDAERRLITLQLSIDHLKGALEKMKSIDENFDLIFCAYGLYYSERPEDILGEMLHWLASDGRIVIVGPFGPNNGPLFNFLERSGVKIPDYVRYTSQDFMEKVVLPFATRNFTKTNVYTLVNPVVWESQEDVFQYWKNSTFFDEEKKEIIKERLERFIIKNNEFINEKWVMMVEMTNRIPEK